VSISLRKPRWLGRGALALVAGAAFLASVSTPARAVMLPGSALFGYYDVGEDRGAGDSILVLVNPNGSANGALGAPVVNACAMIYVFDADQEMGECCGCPLTPTQIATFSFRHNLTADFGIAGFEGPDNDSGIVAIRAASQPNAKGCLSFANPGEINPACNGGCDPTNGFTASPTLLGSITHVQRIDGSRTTVTEVSLFDDGTGDVNENNPYLIQQCSALVGNSSGGGICTCPTE